MAAFFWKKIMDTQTVGYVYNGSTRTLTCLDQVFPNVGLFETDIYREIAIANHENNINRTKNNINRTKNNIKHSRNDIKPNQNDIKRSKINSGNSKNKPKSRNVKSKSNFR